MLGKKGRRKEGREGRKERRKKETKKKGRKDGRIRWRKDHRFSLLEKTVVVDTGPDLGSRALGTSPARSRTCIRFLDNTLPFLCLTFHICTARGQLEALILKSCIWPTGVPGVAGMWQTPCWVLGTQW